MSGHSKWSTIKRAKGAADAKRGQQFTKLSKAITVAAKSGGVDPAGNPRLKIAIDAARQANMPKDNIARAIDRAASSNAENIDEVLYEGYGPGGAAILMEVLTDNRNRTIAEVRSLLNKHGGTMGDAGSVAWMFKSQAIIQLAINGHDVEEVSLAAIEAGANDIDQDGDTLVVFCDIENLGLVSQALSSYGEATVDIQPIATNQLEIDDEAHQKLTTLMELLDEHDDINRVSTNAVI
jgi:YebC/PmpR family DNA-binding regulatory protein